MIDLYCERTGPGLAAEPLNALSNVAFFVAAWLAWRRYGSRPDTRLLSVLLASIGLGSSAFHVLANGTAELADVVPIALFQLCWLALFLRRGLAWRVSATGAATAAFAAVMIASAALPPWLNGSLGYAPALLVLMMLALAPAARALRAAALVFACSLALRSVDLALCAAWPWGTHWLWHILNGVVLYRVVSAYGERVAAR